MARDYTEGEWSIWQFSRNMLFLRRKGDDRTFYKELKVMRWLTDDELAKELDYRMGFRLVEKEVTR